MPIGNRGVGEGNLFNPGPRVYMEKIAFGPECMGYGISLENSPTRNLELVAEAKSESVRDVTAVILDRDRHAELIAEVREAGARIRLIPDGDVAGAISTAWPDSGADILFGIGGTPEGVIAAAALKCMEGELLGRLWPRNDKERKTAEKMGMDLNAALTADDLVRGDNCTSSPPTGNHDGDLAPKASTTARIHAAPQSLVMRSKSGTVRLVNADHQLEKLNSFSAIEFG